MNMRNDWTINENGSLSDIFYTAEETIQNVKDNFDIRRYHSSEGKSIEINGVIERCLVQMPNNPLREFNDYRKIHCPITADVKRGYYVKYEDTVWIVDTNVADVDGTYLSTRMSRCQYMLRWQNINGIIVERWAYSSDQTKYSNGETGSKIISVGDNQYALLLPIDSETKLLKRGMRFAVDFEDSDEPDIYRISNRKVNLNNETYFDRGGTMSLTLSFDSLDRHKDKRIKLEDGREAWICNYIKPNTPILPCKPPQPDKIPNNLSADITGNVNLKAKYFRTYTVNFTDSNGMVIDYNTIDFSWNVVSEFEVEKSITGNKIKLKVKNDELIGYSFLLQCIVDGIVAAEIEITVCELRQGGG